MEVLIKMKNIKNNATNPLTEDLPQRLKMCRENAGLSLRQVAKKINKTAATVCKWENGKIEPYGDTLLQLCEIYNVDITTFYGVTTDNNKMRITPQEIELIKLFRNATKHAQIATKTVLKNCQK
nr:MAG TPA: helix-turn-helix domain protein [Caudoviricetes sp.]